MTFKGGWAQPSRAATLDDRAETRNGDAAPPADGDAASITSAASGRAACQPPLPPRVVTPTQ
jgi:hypothetical protein